MIHRYYLSYAITTAWATAQPETFTYLHWKADLDIFRISPYSLLLIGYGFTACQQLQIIFILLSVLFFHDIAASHGPMLLALKHNLSTAAYDLIMLHLQEQTSFSMLLWARHYSQSTCKSETTVRTQYNWMLPVLCVTFAFCNSSVNFVRPTQRDQFVQPSV